MGTIPQPFRLIWTNTLARNTSWMLIAHASRALMQAAYFVVLARTLTAAGYGRFVGAVAVVAIVAPFSGLGSGNLLVQNVSRDRHRFAQYWGQALTWVCLTGGLLLLLVLLVWNFFLRQVFPLTLILSVAVADLLCARLADVSAQAFQAVERLHRTAQIYAIVHLARLGAALCLLLPMSQETVTTWGFLYLASSAVTGVAAVWLVIADIGRPRLRYGGTAKELWLGFHFSVGLSAQSIYNDIDKSLLAKMSTMESTGIYGAAYRVIDSAFTPVRALLAAAYPSMFQRGAGGLSSSLAYARRLLTVAAVYGLAVGVAIAVLSPFVPMILGQSFAEIPAALRWLALLPVIRVLHYFPADALTGAGLQGPRSAIQILVAFVNVILNVWLIPLYAWRGAAGASLISDGLLVLGMWTIVGVMRKTRRADMAGLVASESEARRGV